MALEAREGPFHRRVGKHFKQAQGLSWLQMIGAPIG